MYTMSEMKILDKKKIGMRVRENHRWTVDETNDLLDNVIRAMKTTGNHFERPTARKFYSEFCVTDSLFEVDWAVKKHKMRHLKATYLKARQWNENVASEMFDSDRKHIRSRIKQICPFYKKLDEIFGPTITSDPIAPTIMEEEGNSFDRSYNGNGNEIEDFSTEETSNRLLTPKQEQFEEIDEAEADESETELLLKQNHSIPDTHTNKSVSYHRTKDKKTNHNPPKDDQNYLTDIDKMKFYFEKEKFQMTCRLEARKLNLEKEKLEFEKVKFNETQKLRKYELDKQFELKKLEIEKDERIQRLELEERNFEINEN